MRIICIFVFVLISFVDATADVESCVCHSERIAWGWGDCPDNPKAPCDWCYGEDGTIIAYAPRTNKSYSLQSDCENLNNESVMLVAPDQQTMEKMEEAGGECSPEFGRNSGRYVCENVDKTKYFELGDTKTKIVTSIQEISLTEAKNLLKNNRNVIWWDPYFHTLFQSISGTWARYQEKPGTTSGNYTICKNDSGEYGVSDISLYPDNQVSQRAGEVLRALPGRALVFPRGTKVCTLQLEASFTFSFGDSQSRQIERHVFEINGKLYRFQGNYHTR